MKTLLLLINSSPFSSGNCLSGLLFCDAALSAGHKVLVFFYGDGVLNANRLICPSTDEINLCQRWQSLAQHNKTLQLIVCNTAANRRGVVAKEEEPDKFNLASHFHAGGLSEFAALSQSADKIVQF